MATKKKISFQEWHIQQLKDPKAARLYLQIAFEEYMKDGNTPAFLLALRDLGEAQGGLGKLARKTKLSRQHLYKVLSTKGNPQMNTIFTIMNALGFQITFKLKVVEVEKVPVKVKKRAA